MSAALPPCGGVHGAQGVVAGGLWVRCGCTAGRSLFAVAGADFACALRSAEFFLSLGLVFIACGCFHGQ